jgi:hypothetical protein
LSWNRITGLIRATTSQRLSLHKSSSGARARTRRFPSTTIGTHDPRKPRAVTDTEFLKGTVDVRTHGRIGNAEALRDLFVQQPLDHQLDDFAFTSR